MKTDRLTLLISSADKAAINARAETLDISVSELVRQAALNLDPEEDSAKAEMEALLPEFDASIERIIATLDRMIANGKEHRREMEYQQSPEYQEDLQRRVWADPRIDRDWVQQLREGALHPEAAS